MKALLKTAAKITLLFSLLLAYPASSFADASLRLCARYSVPLPADRDELRELNRYLLKDYVIDRSRPGREKMIFDLPSDLTGGKKVSVELKVRKQDGSNRELVGALGAANCEGPWDAMSCKFKFRALDLDTEDLAAFLTKKYGDTPRRDGLLEIASRFSNDPIGVAKTAALDGNCK